MSGAPGEAAAPAPAEGPAAVPPLSRVVILIAASLLLWVTRGLSMYFISANTTQIQGALGATQAEANWLVAAFMVPYASLTILLIKIRQEFGLRRFAEVAIAVFVAGSLMHLLVYDVWSALPIRFLAGAAAAPISTLGFLYMLEAFPREKKLTWGVSLALTAAMSAGPLARLISPLLLDLGSWERLYMVEIGLALLAFSVVYLVPLPHGPRQKVLHWRDFVSYPLIATGFGLIAVVLVQGRTFWWFDAPWIGVSLAAAAVCLCLAAALEFTRHTPLINMHWLCSAEVVQFALTLLFFRVLLAEQTSGATGLFRSVGLLDAQSSTLYGIILLSSIAGGLLCGAVLVPGRGSGLFALALACIAVGAWMDSQSTSQTRPADMYLSQALMAFGGAIFLPPAMSTGLMKALRRGPEFITSFVAVFLATQNLGGLFGSAVFSTFVAVRQSVHAVDLQAGLVLSDPVVAQRVDSLSAVYGHVLTDTRLIGSEGLALLGQQVTREATVLAYDDAFRLIALTAGAALLVVLGAMLRARLFPSSPAPHIAAGGA